MQQISQRNPQITISFDKKVQDELKLFIELATEGEKVSRENIEFIKNHAVQIDSDHESFQQNGLDYKSAVIENLLTRSREFYRNITNLQSTLEDRETNLRLIQYMAFLITEIQGMEHPNSKAITDIFNQARVANQLKAVSSKKYIALNPDGTTSLAILISTSLSRPSIINTNNEIGSSQISESHNENPTNITSPIMTTTRISGHNERNMSPNANNGL